MQLVVETGAGLPNANSYIDMAGIDYYLSSNEMAKLSNLSESEQTDRLVTASLFIDYSFNWLGHKKSLEQGLNWPRVNVKFQKYDIPDNYIPLQLKRACAMAISLIMEFGLNVFQETSEARVKKEKLGPLETEYFESLKNELVNKTQFSDINNMLRGLFRVPSNVSTAEVLRR
jgi:hypothetical protein